MFEGLDSGSAMRRIEDWQGGFEDRLRRARELSGRLADLCVRESSEDGLIEVLVGSRGELCDLALGEGVRRRPAAETAREILRIVESARRTLRERVRDVVEETVGADSAAGRAVIAGYGWESRDE